MLNNTFEIFSKEHKHIFWSIALFSNINHQNDILVIVRQLFLCNTADKLTLFVSDLVAVAIELVKLRVFLSLSINMLSNIGYIQKLVFKIVWWLSQKSFPILKNLEKRDVKIIFSIIKENVTQKVVLNLLFGSFISVLDTETNSKVFVDAPDLTEIIRIQIGCLIN